MNWRRTVRNCLVKDEGAALITVLLLVSIMSAGVVVAFDMLAYSVNRTTNFRLHTQARWLALGGEELARVVAEKIYDSNRVLSGAQKAKAYRMITYAIEGGTITGQLRDASNCFNVNSLVIRAEDSQYVKHDAGLLRYRNFLTAQGFSSREAEAMGATLVDWLDSDSRRHVLARKIMPMPSARRRTGQPIR